jgi:tetratricopeptide (TPR) repeat protein
LAGWNEGEFRRRCGGQVDRAEKRNALKNPKSKIQNPKKSQTSKSKRRGWLALIGSLGVVICLGFGIWHLKFQQPPPPQVPLISIDPFLANIITTSRTAVVSAPKSGVAWGKLGQALHAAEFHNEARLCYSNALARDKKEFRWPYLLGLLELENQPDAAIIHLEQAARLAAGKTDAPRFQLARALIERGRYQEAASHLGVLLAANPSHAAAHVELARVHLARGELQQATRELQSGLTNNVTLRIALQIAAQVAQRNGQVDMATQLSRRVVATPRGVDWPDPVLREIRSLRVDRVNFADQANALLQQQRIREAEAAIAALFESFPDDPEGLLLLGRLRYMQKRCAEAEAAYRKHLAIQPNSLNGLIQLGLALMCQQQWTNAAAVLEKAISLKPDFAQAHSNLAVARSHAGDGAGAIRAYRDALRCTPGDFNAHMGLAEELANAGQIEEARQHVESAAALSPNEPRVKKARAQLGVQ